MSGLTKHRDLAKKIDQIRHLLILNARFDGFKKDSHSNLQPNQKGYPSEFEHMNNCSPSPVHLATVFLRQILVYLQYEFIQTANSVNLCLHVKVFHPIINHPLTSDLTHLNCINYCPMPMIHQHETHRNDKA